MVLTKLFSGQQWRHRHREQTYGHSWVGRKEKRGMYGKSNMETYIIICKIDSQWELLYDSKNTNWGSMTT